jgi:hypothetical protein
MNEIAVLDEFDLAVRGIEGDLLQIKKSLLEPEFKKVDNIPIQGSQIFSGKALQGKDISSEIKEKFKPTGKTRYLSENI